MGKQFNYYDDPKGEEMLLASTGKPCHSKEFLMILEQASPDVAIRAITHAKPLLVFWVTPTGEIVDANDAHFDNPPNGDKSVLSSPTHKGHLRGRAALFGDVAYVVIYGDKRSHALTAQQIRLLKQSHSRILAKLVEKGVPLKVAGAAQFIQEDGQDIHF